MEGIKKVLYVLAAIVVLIIAVISVGFITVLAASFWVLIVGILLVLFIAYGLKEWIEGDKPEENPSSKEVDVSAK